MTLNVGRHTEVHSMEISGKTGEVFVGDYTVIGRGTLIDLSFAVTDKPPRVSIGHDCKIEPRCVLLHDADLKNGSTLLANARCAESVQAYHVQHRAADFRCIGDLLDAVKWWKHIPPRSFRATQRKRAALLAVMPKDVMTSHKEECDMCLRQFCGRLPNDIPPASHVFIVGTESFLLASLRFLISKADKGCRVVCRVLDAETGLPWQGSRAWRFAVAIAKYADSCHGDQWKSRRLQRW